MRWMLALLWLTLLQPDITQTLTLTGYAGPVDLSHTLDEPAFMTVTAHSLSAEPVDVTLEILLGTQRIAFNDDYAGESSDLLPLDSAIHALPLMQPGGYTIRVHSFSGAQDGDIAITIHTQPLVRACILPEQIVTLSANRAFTCTLALNAGDRLSVTAEAASDRLDPLLAVLDAEGQQVAINDDHAGGDPALNPLDAQIGDWHVPVDGNYQLVLRDFAGQGGVITLKLDISS